MKIKKSKLDIGKTIILALIFIFTFLINCKLNIVNAETVDASIKIAGRNTFGRELDIEVDCKDAGSSDCYVSDTHWYYSDSKATDGGTEIIDSERGGSGYSNYYISEELVGKYIYVVATISSYDSNYESITLTDITDDATNVTAMVDNYIDYTDNSKYSIDATATFQVGATLTLTLNKADNDENSYYVYLSNGEKPLIEETEQGCNFPDTSREDYTKFKMVNNDGTILIKNDWYLLKGYNKAYIVKHISDKDNGGYYCEVTENPITIEKPAIPSLGSRFQFYLFTDEYNELSTFPLFPYDGTMGSHMINTKIGVIEDSALLKKLANGTNDSLSLLLEYAKNSDGTTFKYSDEHYYDNDIGSFKVKDGTYYYVYTTYENQDGLYRDFSDVAVVMGYAGMLVNDVKWDSSFLETDTIWEKFIEEFKENEFTKMYSEDEGFKIESDDSSLNIKLGEVTTTFKYENGIVSYIAEESRSDDKLFIDSFWQTVALQVYCDMFDYDVDKALEYIQNNKDLTIEKDGFEYVLKDLNISEESDGSSLNIDGEAFTTLKFDLVNGLKNYKVESNPNVDQPIPEDKAPETGYLFGVASIGLLGILGYTGIHTYKVIKRKNKVTKI